MMSAAAGIRAILREGTRCLRASGYEHARREAEWLLSRLMDVQPLELYLADRPVAPPVIEQFLAHVRARSAGRPLQYLLREAEFFGGRFAVQPGVFIPRPETEAVVEAALERLRPLEAARGRPLRLLDLGTGSGCIAVTLAERLATCAVVAVELSWTALHTARRNIIEHGMGARVSLIQGSWTQPLRGRFDGIIANPPYVPSASVEQLPLDVRQEPRVSLDGGPDGLREARNILAQMPARLEPGGVAALECGEHHVEVLQADVTQRGWVETVHAIHDLAGRPRGVLIVRHGPTPHRSAGSRLLPHGQK